MLTYAHKWYNMGLIYVEVLRMKLKKNIMIDEEVFSRVSEYASSNGISFSGALSVLAGQALDAMKGIDGVKQLVEIMEQLQQKGAGAPPNQ